ncbi:helix-turn-helix domain-containing protein, partial [Bacillus cereus]|nr:helix-turn-helix domain-containing protein [Bacillus cereus]
MKKCIDVLAQPESYHNLSTFSNVQELNQTIRVYRDVIKTSIKRADV